ncbi:hypothetical protein ScPMuIL_006522 [Solemya velum]
MADEKKGISEACMIDDLENLSVRELKGLLRDRGARISGTKRQLIERARGVINLKLTPRSEVINSDKEIAKQRNFEKFTTPLGEKLPKPDDVENKWIDSVDTVPAVSTSDLYNYLVLNRNRTFDRNATKAKRQLKAKVFYEDKHVHSIKYCAIKDACSHCYVKCKVIPSLPTGTEKQKPDYATWVCLSKISGHVHSAGCTCSAGDGESCNHIAALLYALVDVTNRKKDGLHSSTSAPCKWNMPRKRKLSPRKAQHIVFKKQKYEATSPKKSTRTCSRSLQFTKVVERINVENFASDLKKCAPNAAFLLSDTKFFSKEDSKSKEDLLPNLHSSVDFMYNNNVDLAGISCRKHFDAYFNELKVVQTECDIIEQLTKGQSINENWKRARIARLTASNFGTICKQKDTTAPDSCLKTIMAYTDFEAKSVKWGSSHEAAARKIYMKAMKMSHLKMRVISSGLIVNPTYPHLGCSPDGLLFCEHCTPTEGILEIKCPYKWRFMTPYQASKDKSFCCELYKDEVKLKKVIAITIKSRDKWH